MPPSDVTVLYGKHATDGGRMVCIPRASVAGALARAAGRASAGPDVLSCERLAGGHGPIGVRVKSLGGPGETQPSIVVKLLRADDENDEREFRVYTSARHALPESCRLPQLFGTWNSGDGYMALYLEDVGRAPGLARSAYLWQRDAYQTAARCLGQFNAALLGHPLVEAPWLLRRHISTQVDRWLVGEDWIRSVRGNSVLYRRLERCCARSQPLLRAFEAQRVTFCHQDASPANVLVRGSDRRTTLIDWELCGAGPLGQEVAPLIWGSWVYSSASSLIERERVVLDGYLAGLAQHGLVIDRAVQEGVRFSYLVAAPACYLASTVGGGGAAVIDLLMRRWEEALSLTA